jgi:hypothetical protein
MSVPRPVLAVLVAMLAAQASMAVAAPGDAADATMALARAAAAAPQPSPTAAPPRRPGAPPGRPGAAAPGAAPAQAPESFAEKVVVREIEVVVELPESLRGSRRKSLAPQDFQVVEDGRFRQVVKAAPVTAGEAGAWQLVIYCDRVLADPETVFATANALAQRAEQLTSLGTVALVVADPAPRFLMAETREPKMLEQALIDIAAQAGRERDAARQGKAQAPPPGQARGPGRPQPPAEAGAAPAPEAVRRQEDRLISVVTGLASSGPRALLLVANGFDTSTSGDGADSATAAVAEEPARTLAAYGWITISAAMRRQDLGVQHREVTDVERIRQSNAGREAPGSTVPPEILPQAAPRSRLQYDGVLGVFVEPSSAALLAIASATAGTVVGYPTQLTAALNGLSKRWHIYYLAPDPEDGRPRPVEVRLSPEGTPLRAPVWRRSSTPEEVSAGRLRQILAGGAGHGTLPVTAQAGAAPGGGQQRSLQVTVGAFSVPDSAAAGPFRVSIAFAGAPGTVPTVQHRLLADAAHTAKGWTETVPLDLPPGTRMVGVEVEDLTHQLWGATQIDLAPFKLPASH